MELAWTSTNQAGSASTFLSRTIFMNALTRVKASDGLNLYFYALTAHFGQWLALGRRGCNVRRWQVEAGLIYGQVKKSYRGRKLVSVTHVMRLGTEAALKVALQGLGYSGRLNTAFIERVN